MALRFISTSKAAEDEGSLVNPLKRAVKHGTSSLRVGKQAAHMETGAGCSYLVQQSPQSVPLNHRR